MTQVIIGHVACVSTAPRCAAQVVIRPLPTSCSQNGICASAARVPSFMTRDLPAQTTKPSQTSSRTQVMKGGEPKCMASGRAVAWRICRLPRMSVCGMGLSNMATLL